MMRKKGRRAAGISMLCALALTASACGGGGGSSKDTSSSSGGTPVKGGTLNILGSSDVDYVDPNLVYYTIGSMALRLWSRTLFANPAVEGKTDTTVPDLATQMPTTSNGGVSKDGLTYTIKLRSGVKWNTKPARAVTAADAVRGLKRTCNPVLPFGGSPDFATLFVGFQKFCADFAKAGKTPKALGDYMESHNIPGYQAKGDSTLVIKLTQPAAYLPSMMTMSAFNPAPIEFNKYLPGSAQLAQNTISDGPYQIDSYKPTKSMNFSRNPEWDASTDPIRKAYVDKIKVDETVTQESAQQQFETGTPNADLEFGTSPPASRIPQLQAAKDPKLFIGQTTSSNPFFGFNQVSANENGAMKKLQVRQALEYGINRDNLIQVMGGKTLNVPLTGVIPETLPSGQVGAIDMYKYDPTKAKQLLAQAGYPHGLTLNFLYRPSSESGVKSFQTVKQDLTKIGVTLKGVQSPDADFYTKYLQDPKVAKRGVWDLAYLGWGADWQGPGAELSYFKPLFYGKTAFPPTGSNYGFYNNPVTNKLIDKAVSAKTTEESAQLFHQADEQVMKDAAFFPVTNDKEAHYHAAQVHNTVYIVGLQGFDPSNVWLDKDKQGG
jgi:peptide/nickel transport system substrate-binding protein